MIILVHPAPSTLVVIVIRPGTHRCILCVDEFTATQAALSSYSRHLFDCAMSYQYRCASKVVTAVSIESDAQKLCLGYVRKYALLSF